MTKKKKKKKKKKKRKRKKKKREEKNRNRFESARMRKEWGKASAPTTPPTTVRIADSPRIATDSDFFAELSRDNCGNERATRNHPFSLPIGGSSFFHYIGRAFRVLFDSEDTRGKTAAIGRYSVGIDARTGYRHILIKPFVEYSFRVYRRANRRFDRSIGILN